MGEKWVKREVRVETNLLLLHIYHGLTNATLKFSTLTLTFIAPSF